jgi:hypothetical protein
VVRDFPAFVHQLDAVFKTATHDPWT